MVTGSVEHVMQKVNELPDAFDKKKVLEIIDHTCVRYSECIDDLGAAVLIMYEIFGEMATIRMTVDGELARIKAGSNDE